MRTWAFVACVVATVGCRRESPPSARAIGSADRAMKSPPEPEPEVCLDVGDAGHPFRAVGLVANGDVLFDVKGEHWLRLDVETGRYTRHDKAPAPFVRPVMPTVPASSGPGLVSVCLEGKPCRSVPAKGCAPPHEKSGYPGCLVDVDDDQKLLAVDTPDESLIYEISTGRVLHHFDRKTCAATCFFGNALFCSGDKRSAFVDPRTGATVAHLGGTSMQLGACSDRNGWHWRYWPEGLWPQYSARVAANTWAFLTRSGDTVVIQNVVSHTFTNIGLGVTSVSAPRILAGPKKLVVVLEEGDSRGSAIVIDPVRAAIVRRTTMKPCASDAG